MIRKMHERDRKAARIKLDREMQPFRRAGREKNPSNELLRGVRRAVGIPLKEIAEKLGVAQSSLLDAEIRERRRTITLESLARMAKAMGCKVVYGVVPEDGGTLEQLAEERLWRAVLEDEKAAGGTGQEQAGEPEDEEADAA